MTNNYQRLNFSTDRVLSDFVIDSTSLTNQQINDLIVAKKTDILADFKDTSGVSYFGNLYSFIPDFIFDYVYEHSLRSVSAGLVKFCLDDEIDGIHWGKEMIAAFLEAFRIRDYQEQIEAGADPVVIQPKDLSRTVGSQSIGDMSISFESERLGIKIDQPFEQFLSTVPNGIELIDKYKQRKSIKPSGGIC